MTLSRVAITNNRTQNGGGILNANLLTIEDSTITSNTASLGGGIYNTNILYVYGSTITQNVALVSGGGIFNSNTTYDDRTRAYIDDLTLMVDNRPNNFAGKPYIPA